MDPNENLSRQIDLASCIDSGSFTPDEAIELAGLVLDLHTWIFKGGFLPDSWEGAQKRAKEQ